MSNIIFKGDTVKNFGEYLPNIYIDNVVVRNNGANAVFLDIAYSLFFHVTDEFNHEDISELLENVSFYFAISNIKDENKQLLTQENIIFTLKDSKNRFLLGNRVVTSEEDLKLTMLYSFSKESIQQKLVSGEYTDDVYDSQERKVMIISAEETISVITENKTDRHFYLYAFTSLYDANEFSRLNMLSENSDIIYNSAISNISYEKIFSPNLNIIPQTQVIYLDIEEAKYSDTPILGLNGLYYKNQTVTRELIAEKVNELINRFTTRLSLPRLTDATNSLKTVLKTHSNSENLLVEIERVRKSFPNKTNNNPTGNLYAALSRLVINFNSSFPPSEIVTKQRMVTGKVIDRREELRFNLLPPAIISENYIPDDGFFIERTRLSYDEENDLSSNDGFFIFRYEAMVREKSKISQLINLQRLLEFPLPSSQSDMKKLLFSFIRSNNVQVIKYETDTSGEFMSKLHRSYDLYSPIRKYSDTYGKGWDQQAATLYGQIGETVYRPYIKEDYHDLKGETPEIVSSYEFQDLDKYTSFYEVEQNELGGMKFGYRIKMVFEDTSMKLSTHLERLLLQAYVDLQNYYNLAQEICSYNNIQNKFNNFFVNAINENLEESGERAPWETSVFAYCLLQYILTDRFQNIEEVSKYSKNLIKTISPSTGKLESISNLLEEVLAFINFNLASGSEYNIKKTNLESESVKITIEKDFQVVLETQNPQVLAQDLQSDYRQFIENLFLIPDPIQIIPWDSNSGDWLYQNVLDEKTYTQSEFYEEFKKELILYLENQSIKLEYINRKRVTVSNGRNNRSTTYKYKHEIDNSYGNLIYSLATIRSLGDGDGYGDSLNEIYYQHSDFSDNNWQSTVLAQVMGSLANALGEVFDAAILRRNTHQISNGGMSEPFDYPILNPGTSNEMNLRNVARQAIQDRVLSSLNTALELAYDYAKSKEGKLMRALTNSEKSNLVSYSGDSGQPHLDNMIDLVYKYYRDNYENLMPSLKTQFLTGGSRANETEEAIYWLKENYEQPSYPKTSLPDFIDSDPYYHGAALPTIADLDYDEDVAE